MKMQVLDTMRPEFGFRMPGNQPLIGKKDNDATICRHDVIVNFFDVVVFLLSSLVTVPEIQKSKIPPSVLPNIWGLGQVRDTKFGKIISNKMLLNAAKARVTDFSVSELLRENQQGG